MAKTIITVNDNGSLRIEGEFEMADKKLKVTLIKLKSAIL